MYSDYNCTVVDLIAGLAALPSDMLVLTYQDFGHYDYAFGKTTKADLEGMLNSRQFHIMLCVDSPEIRRAI